ncbi:heme oxygenase (biliverdin-producing) [Glutamicibacter sp. NPDC087831]|uniref:biliverdin-producing heme oxygenase n=1 Tax=Glutamicibacter sp. NPDC087831 TaxID=3363998 RepID=UPI0037F94A6E
MTITDTSQFSAQLRSVTQEDHHAAESSDFITTLMGGERSARDYTLLISQYHYIYEALEEEVRALASHPALTDIFDLHLERGAQIIKDLEVLLPMHDLEESPAALPATEDYVAALRAAAADPARLVAHHYLRYLGDLSGGLAIGKLVSRHYSIPDEALNMWKFDAIEKPKLYKDAYREKLDTFGANPSHAEAVLDEAKRGFQWNKAIFEDLLRATSRKVPAAS